MILKPKSNAYLNITLIILGAISFLTGFAMSVKLPVLKPFLSTINVKHLHEWVSYILTFFVMLHLVVHLSWFKSLIKKCNRS